MKSVEDHFKKTVAAEESLYNNFFFGQNIKIDLSLVLTV